MVDYRIYGTLFDWSIPWDSRECRIAAYSSSSIPT